MIIFVTAFVGLLVVAAPIIVALGGCSLAYALFSGNMPITTLIQTVFGGLASFPLLAIPLFMLLVMLLSDRSYQPWRTMIWIWGLSGLGTWLIGRGGSVHVGASSIVFGLAAFLIIAGLRLRSWRSLAVAVVVVMFYGGIFYGALPHRGPISWEGHLCGLIAGVWIAVRNGARKKTR